MLEQMLSSVQNLRVYSFVSDSARVPAAVIGEPVIDFSDRSSGFCMATWLFPSTIITKRSNDKAAHEEMSKLVLDIANALDGELPEDIFSVEPLSARPVPGVSINGQELPAYLMEVRVRA